MLLVHLLEGAWPGAHLEHLHCISCIALPEPFLPDFISSCTGGRALGKERWLVAEHEVVAEVVAASLLVAVAANTRLHLAPRSDQQAGVGAALSALLMGICLQAAPSPCSRAWDEGCRVKSRHRAAYYSLTFLSLTEQLMLSVQQRSQHTNGLSQEERGRRQGMIVSGSANNGRKQDLTVL